MTVRGGGFNWGDGPIMTRAKMNRFKVIWISKLPEAIWRVGTVKTNKIWQLTGNPKFLQEDRDNWRTLTWRVGNPGEAVILLGTWSENARIIPIWRVDSLRNLTFHNSYLTYSSDDLGRTLTGQLPTLQIFIVTMDNTQDRIATYSSDHITWTGAQYFHDVCMCIVRTGTHYSPHGLIS